MLGRETLNKSGPGVRCALSADIVKQYQYEAGMEWHRRSARMERA